MEIFSGRAQGTIEYLVIVAIIVVLGLVVVGLLSGMSDVSELSSNISGVSSKTGSGGISVTEAVADVDSGVLVLSNVSGEPLTVTSISAGGESNPYSKTIFLGEKSSFVLNSVGSSCLCSSGDVRKSCDYVVTYRTADGLVKTTTIAVSNECVSVASAVSGTNPNDLTAPVVALSSPVDDVNVFSKTVSFVFSVTEANTISSCTLRAGGDANNYTGIIAGSNTISYTFSNDKLADWNISCTDASNNTGVSATRTVDVDSNAYQVTTCLELQEMENDLAGNYELMNNIDCSATSAWNSGAGFEPIGYCGVCQYCGTSQCAPDFTGTFNGNSYTITGLQINRPAQNGVGLFGQVISSTCEGRMPFIGNVTLSDVNIIGNSNIGGLIGYAECYSVSNVTASGNIFSHDYDAAGIMGQAVVVEMSDVHNSIDVTSEGAFPGGIVGDLLYSNLSNCSNNGDVYTSWQYIGGIAGEVYESNVNGCTNYGTIQTTIDPALMSEVGGIGGTVLNGNITNSKNFGSIIGYSYVGGLVGMAGRGGSIVNSYSKGSVSGTSVTGGLIGAVSAGYPTYPTIKNSFATGELLVSGSGLIGSNGGSTVTNTWWYNSSNVCCGSGSCASCTKASGVSDFYSSSHAVYTTAPVWDSNWVWSGTTYPTLAWE